MHAWDQPPETLLALAPAQGVHLLMPRLGEVIEPAQVEGVVPWWRGVAAMQGDEARQPPTEPVPVEAMNWPID